MNNNITYYLMIMNNKHYDFEKSKKDGHYYWSIERSKALKFLKNNIIVYIYESSNRRIIYKCELVEKELIEDNDKLLSSRESTYIINKSSNKPIKDEVFIKLGNFVDSKENQLLYLDLLKQNGLKTIRMGQIISEKKDLVKYLELAFNSNDSKYIDSIAIENIITNIISKIKNPNEKEYLKTKSEELSGVLRGSYRIRLFERNNRYNDVNNEKFDELSISNQYLFEAAHIVDVKYIKKFLIENEKNLINSINLDSIKHDLDLMLSEKNGIFIPFKYHYYFDKEIIYLNSKLKFKVNKKFENVIKIFDEEFFDLKSDLLECKEIIKLVELRNKYRKL